MRSWLLILLLTLAAALVARADDSSPDADRAGKVAKDFINGYVRALPEFHQGYEAAIAWIKKSPLVTEGYKKSIARLYHEALRQDPESGYGSDAVIGGQDSPSHFHVKKSKVSGDTAEVVLFGDDPFPMKVKVALIRTDGKWLVDKSGDMLVGDGPRH